MACGLLTNGSTLIPYHFVPIFRRTRPESPEVITVNDNEVCDDVQPTEDSEPETTNDTTEQPQPTTKVEEINVNCPFINDSSDDIHPLSNGCLNGDFIFKNFPWIITPRKRKGR